MSREQERYLNHSPVITSTLLRMMDEDSNSTVEKLTLLVCTAAVILGNVSAETHLSSTH